MQLKLTAAQAQTVIDSQARELAALKLRLKRAHVTLKYMTRATGQLTPALLQSAVASLQSLIDCDQPEDRDDFGFSPRYDPGQSSR